MWGVQCGDDIPVPNFSGAQKSGDGCVCGEKSLKAGTGNSPRCRSGRGREKSLFSGQEHARALSRLTMRYRRIPPCITHSRRVLSMSAERATINVVSVNTAPERAKRLLGQVIERVKDKYSLVHAGNSESQYTNDAPRRKCLRLIGCRSPTAIEGVRPLLLSIQPPPGLMVRCSGLSMYQYVLLTLSVSSSTAPQWYVVQGFPSCTLPSLSKAHQDICDRLVDTRAARRDPEDRPLHHPRDQDTRHPLGPTSQRRARGGRQIPRRQHRSSHVVLRDAGGRVDGGEGHATR